MHINEHKGIIDKRAYSLPLKSKSTSTLKYINSFTITKDRNKDKKLNPEDTIAVTNMSLYVINSFGKLETKIDRHKSESVIITEKNMVW